MKVVATKLQGRKPIQTKDRYPYFSGDLDIKGFLDWLTEVDRFFESTENRKVKFVAYRLKEGASIWWDRLWEVRMKEGCGLVQTYSRMKQLLVGKFLPLDCKHGSRRVNEYTIKKF